jgi:glutamine synthetase
MTDVKPRDARKTALERAEKDRVRLVNLQFVDIAGIVKSVSIPVRQLEDSLNQGTWFDGSSIQGFTRIFESDMFLMPDPATYAVIPWHGDSEGTVARFICDVHMPNGDPFKGDPRYALKRALMEAEKNGFVFNTGPELEFFLFKRNGEQIHALPHDRGGYFDLILDEAFEIRREMVEALHHMGLSVEASHHEVAPGQHEIDFQYADALTTADRATTFKYTLKAVAQKHGVFATFMPKPIAGINGSGMHTHQSLFSKETGKTAFFDSKRDYNLSEAATQFIAGQLKHIRAMTAVLNPTVNSYKRLVPGYEAPVYICWGQTNRSALIRIPRYTPGREGATRCELRCPDPAANPYLAFALMLRAGLDGIRNKMTPPAPIEENVYHFDDAELEKRSIGTLPQTLNEAMREMRASELVRDALGDHLFEEVLNHGKAQWDGFRLQVTPWELETYLPLL